MKHKARYGIQGVRRYHLEIIPESLDISGDTALAGGRTKESIETPLGPVTYHSVWSARLVKKDGAWKTAGYKPAE